MSEYTVSRSITIKAGPETVRALVEDFREWQKWSPWEDLDPDLERTYSGAERGVGAQYAWRGNKKAGEGSMEITETTDSAVQVRVTFLKPFKSTSTSTFEMTGGTDITDVTWTMRGQTPGGLMGLMSKLMPMEKWIGKDFDKGLDRLKATAES